MQTQHAFTRYIRDPKNAPKPSDIEERRINIYRDLMFTNIASALSDGFPVVKTICSEQQWENICRDFYHRHPSQSPYFSDIPQEFIHYLEHERTNNSDTINDAPFLLELAHYEWLEFIVSIADDETYPPISDPFNQALTVAPTALAAAYTYPVHKISPDFLPAEPPDQPTYLAVYRNIEHTICFLEITPTTHALLIALADNTSQLTKDILSTLAKNLQHPDPSVVIQGGLSIINDFIHRGIVVSAPN